MMRATSTATTLACILLVGFLAAAGCNGTGNSDCPDGDCPDGAADAADTGSDADDGGPKDTADAGDTENGDTSRRACNPDAGSSCELSCGGRTCDGSSEACHVQPPGVDLGTPDGDAGPGAGNSYYCEAFPDPCKSDQTCSCLERESSRAFASCESGPNGITVTHLGQ